MDWSRWASSPKARSRLAKVRRFFALCVNGALAAGLCAIALASWAAFPAPGDFKANAWAALPMSAKVAARGALRAGVWSWEGEQIARARPQRSPTMLPGADGIGARALARARWAGWSAASAALCALTLAFWGWLGRTARIRLIMMGLTSRAQKTSPMLRALRWTLAHALPAAGIFLAGVG